jgi:hypothetical protein
MKEKSLEVFREPLIDTLREGLRTERLKLPAINGCVALVQIPAFWGPVEVEEILKSMNDILLNGSDVEVRYVRCSFGRIYANRIMQIRSVGGACHHIFCAPGQHLDRYSSITFP